MSQVLGRVALILAVMLASASLFAQTEKAADNRPFDYKSVTLKNGLQVISLEDFSAPSVAVELWYHVGSKDEENMRHGFAHMFEHMMFQGTELLSNTDHFDVISSTGGNTNAYTAFDQTVYLANIPANQLEMVLWLEAERMGFLGINDESFATERKVVEEELRNGREAPYGEAPEKVLAEIFGEEPYGWTPGGSISHLRDATSYDLQKFWETYYVPNNAVLVVAGAVSHDEVQSLAKKYFEWIPAGPEPPRRDMTIHHPDGPVHIEIEERQGPVPIVGVGVKIPGTAHEDMVPLQVLMSIVGGGPSSRAYKRLVREDEVAVEAGAAAFAFEGMGLAGAFAVVNPLGGDPEKAMETLEEVIERVKKEGVTDAEMEKARNQMLRAEVTQLLTVSSKASALGQAAVIYGDVEEVNRSEAKIRNVTKEDVLRVANEYFLPNRMYYLHIKPNLFGMALGKLFGKTAEEENSPIAESPEGAEFGQGKPGLSRPDWWGEKPPVAPLIDPEFDMTLRESVLGNGLKMVVVENREVPFVTMTLGMKAGAFTEPAKLPGTASMASQMVTRGTESYDFEQLSEILDSNAISLSGNVGGDGGTVNVSAVADKAALAMELMGEVVRNASFPEDEYEKLLEQARTGKQIEEKTPEYLAGRELAKRMYKGHPYENPADATLASLDDLKLGELQNWWSTYVRPETTVLYVAGDIGADEAIEMAKGIFGDWSPEGDIPSLAVPPLPERQDRRIYLIDKPGANQSQIRMGEIGPGRDDPQYYATRVLTDIFGGGGLDSRLNASLRVEKGLTYGAYGGFTPRRFGGRFFISTFSKTDSTVEAVHAILAEIDRMREEPPTEEEMRKSISSIVGSFALSRETPQDTVSDLWNLEQNDLDDDYYEKYIEGISSMTSEEVDAAANSLIDPDKLTIVIVGDAKKIRKGLEEIAPVELVK